MTTISVRLPDALERRLRELARAEGVAKSSIARQAIEAYLEQRERARHMAALSRETRLQNRDAARAVAQEALEVDNEALAIAETRGPSEPG